MINLLDQLKKPEPLSKKTDVTPQQPNIATALGATPKQAEMAPTPQVAKSESQKQMRKAKVEAEAPREAEDTSMVDKAAGMIDKLANLNTAVTTQSEGELGAAVESGTARTSEEFIGQDVDVTGEALDALAGNMDTLDAALTVTVGELKGVDDDVYAYAQELGLPDDTTVEQLKAAIDNEIAETTAIVDNQRDITNDPNATPAERQQARQLMRDYGAAHLLATDAELDNFSKDMGQIGILEVGGQSYTLEDLADDPAVMSKLLFSAESLLDNPDLTAEELGIEQEGLFNFVKNHSSAILSTLDQEKENLQGAKDAVKKNEDLIAKLPDNYKNLLELNPLTTEDLSQSSDFLKVFSSDWKAQDPSLSAEEAQRVIESLSDINPALAKSMADMSASEIEQTVLNWRGKIAKIESVQQARNNEDLLVSTVGITPDQFSAYVEDVQANPQAYAGEDVGWIRMFDSNLDGVMDDMSAVKGRVGRAIASGKEFGTPRSASEKYQEKFDQIEKQPVEVMETWLNIPEGSDSLTHLDTTVTKLKSEISKLDDFLKENPEAAKMPWFINNRRKVERLRMNAEQAREEEAKTRELEAEARQMGVEADAAERASIASGDTALQAALNKGDLSEQRKRDLIRKRRGVSSPTQVDVVDGVDLTQTFGYK